MVNLWRSLALNVAYVALNLVNGVGNGSWWQITLSAYYFILTVTRFALLHGAAPGSFGKDLSTEWRKYRATGWVLLLLNVILSGLVVVSLQVKDNAHYEGWLIYAMAAWSFFKLISATVALLRQRGGRSPVLSSSAVLTLAAAIISMLALETAMLSRFNGEDEAFRWMMISISGAVIAVLFLVSSAIMIIRANIKLKKRESNESP